MKTIPVVSLRLILSAAMLISGIVPVYAGQQALELDIDQVSRMALESNFDIQVYRLEKSISEKDLIKAQAVYDTQLDASYKYNEERLKKSSAILGTRNTTVSQGAGLEKKLPTGTLLSLGFDHSREATDSPFATLNPYHESSADISVRQSLGKNALGIIDRNTVKITGINVDNAGYTSLDKIERELSGVQKAYWGLILANRQVAITEEILESARQLYGRFKENADLGIVEPPEFYAVDANLKERQSDVLLANDHVNNALNAMRLLLALDKDIVVVPKDSFSSEPITAAFEELLAAAIAQRRDYKIAQNAVRAMDLDIQLKRSSLWPEIDLKATMKKNGLDRDFNRSVREISSGDFPEYTVEVIFSIPLENSAARAEYSQAKLVKMKAIINLKKTECLILVQVHDAFIHAQNAYYSAELLRQAGQLQQKKYEGEQQRFDMGRSDTDRLIRYQQDHLYAALRSLQASYAYKSAVIELNLAMNNLLQQEEGSL